MANIFKIRSNNGVIEIRYEIPSQNFELDWTELSAEGLDAAELRLGHGIFRLNLDAAFAIARTQYSCPIRFKRLEGTLSDTVYVFEY